MIYLSISLSLSIYIYIYTYTHDYTTLFVPLVVQLAPDGQELLDEERVEPPVRVGLCIYIYIYIYTYACMYVHIFMSLLVGLGIHYRGVQWEGGAVDWGSTI